MSGFKMDDYVDVAERIREFSEKYPDGSLQSEIVIRDGGVLCKAFAYRTADDDRPGVGHAFEPVPGKTPFTKDSEVMNAVTSAWGRAIVALGFQTKKIASAQEIKARQNGDEPHAAAVSAAQREVQATAAPDDPGSVILTFGKHKDKPIKDVPAAYLSWWIEQEPPKTEQQKAQRAAAELFLLGATGVATEVPAGQFSDADVPF